MLAVLLSALLVAARAQVNPGRQFFSGPLRPAPLTPQGQPPPNGFAQYAYGYKTEDPAEATYSEQNEQRDGNTVTGFYSTLLPDGRVQVVNYVADEGGYRATVTYQTPDGFPLPAPQQPPGSPPPRAEPRQPTFLFSGPLPPLTADLGPGFGRRVGTGGDDGGAGGFGGGPGGGGGPAKREAGLVRGEGPVGGAGPVRTGQSGPAVSGGGSQDGGGGGSQLLSGGRPQIRRLQTPGPRPTQPKEQRGRPNQPPAPRGGKPGPQQGRRPVRPAGDNNVPWSPKANAVPNGGNGVSPADHTSTATSWRLPASPPPPPSAASAWLIADNTIKHGWTSSPKAGQPGPAASGSTSAQHGGRSGPRTGRQVNTSAASTVPKSTRPAPTSDGSWSHKAGSPAGPSSSWQTSAATARQQTPPLSTNRVVTAAAQFSTRRGRLSPRAWPAPVSVRAPRQSGGFAADSLEPAAARASEEHPLARFINGPAQRFSPQLGEWNPMRIRK